MALTTGYEYSYQDTGLDLLLGDDASTLSTSGCLQILWELLRSGAINVFDICVNLRPFIQIVLITRVAHLLIDLYPFANRWKHLTSCLSGLYLINSFVTEVGGINSGHVGFMRKLVFSVIIFYISTYYIVGKMISTTRCDSNKYKRRFYLAKLFVVMMPITMNEILIYFQVKLYLTSLRSILMTIAMKVFSQLDNYEDNDAPLDNLLAISSYFLHPASCLFGPWHKRSTTAGDGNQAAFTERSKSQVIGEFARQLKRAAAIFGQTLLVQLASESLLDPLATILGVLEPISTPSHLASVFLSSQKFRFSHYFMCYLSWAQLVLWQDAGSSASETQICRIRRVEWPRSLVEVAKLWNIPMSNWLRDHVFTPMRTIKPSSSDNATSVLVTFAVSALFHGFKFNIWSVLIQLGLLGLLEHQLRKKLSIKLNACISSKRCSSECQRHRWTGRNSWMVGAINAAFRLLVIVHLSYLGYVFRGNPDENTYSDDLAAWSELHFYSPLLAIIIFAIEKLTL